MDTLSEKLVFLKHWT